MSETHADAGDRANDAVRVDATQVRARCAGEGGNLGWTQAARVEYSRAGGRINTDFIDNSAGVDTSDHEVNIKILLTDAETHGRLTEAERNELLPEMTGDVAALVLAHNIDQNQALAMARYQAARFTATVVMISRRNGWSPMRSPKRSRSGLGKYWMSRSARYGSSGRSLATMMSASRIFVHANRVASSGLHSPSPAAILRVISDVDGIVSRCRSR